MNASRGADLQKLPENIERFVANFVHFELRRRDDLGAKGLGLSAD